MDLYARYLCSRDALGLKAEQPAGQARRATIGYLVYKDGQKCGYIYTKYGETYKKSLNMVANQII